jgi:hypothetical protein
LIEGLDFAGGDVLRVGATSPTATNLTPDTTGLQLPSTAAFRDVMRTGRMAGRSLHPLMPYKQYAKLTDADLDDMFSYLRSVKAVRHVVDATAAPTLCRVCKNQHGGGDRNN